MSAHMMLLSHLLARSRMHLPACSPHWLRLLTGDCSALHT